MGSYFYLVQAGDIRTPTGETIPNPGNVMSFTATPEEAHAKFFMHGFNLDLDSDLFRDNGMRFVSDEFPTGKGENQNEDIPNSLEILTKGESPFPGKMPVGGITFGKLIVSRFPNTAGGKAKASRKHRRSSKRTRRTRRKTIKTSNRK